MAQSSLPLVPFSSPEASDTNAAIAIALPPSPPPAMPAAKQRRRLPLCDGIAEQRSTSDLGVHSQPIAKITAVPRPGAGDRADPSPDRNGDTTNEVEHLRQLGRLAITDERMNTEHFSRWLNKERRQSNKKLTLMHGSSNRRSHKCATTWKDAF